MTAPATPANARTISPVTARPLVGTSARLNVVGWAARAKAMTTAATATLATELSNPPAEMADARSTPWRCR